jgi:hypothetical protein
MGPVGPANSKGGGTWWRRKEQQEKKRCCAGFKIPFVGPTRVILVFSSPTISHPSGVRSHRSVPVQMGVLLTCRQPLYCLTWPMHHGDTGLSPRSSYTCRVRVCLLVQSCLYKELGGVDGQHVLRTVTRRNIWYPLCRCTHGVHCCSGFQGGL